MLLLKGDELTELVHADTQNTKALSHRRKLDVAITITCNQETQTAETYSVCLFVNSIWSNNEY